MDNLKIKLVNKNNGICKKVPCKPFLDLACAIVTTDESTAFQYDPQLFEDVLKATEDDYVVLTMYETIVKYCNVPEDDSFLLSLEMLSEDLPLLSITNTAHSSGAATMLNNKALKEAAERLNTNDLLIIPCSTDEILVSPASMEIDSLKEIIHHVNTTEVPKELFLSDSVYKYVGGDDKVIIVA